MAEYSSELLLNGRSDVVLLTPQHAVVLEALDKLPRSEFIALITKVRMGL